MLPGRFKASLIVAAALLVAAAPWAHAQAPGPEPQHWTPFGPSEIRYDLELFKPPELSLYGNGPQPNTGMFFSYERLYWYFNRPPSAIIGSPTAAPPESNSFLPRFNSFDPEFFPTINSLDVGTLRATTGWGNRWEIGYMNDEETGWLVSVLDNVSQFQSQSYEFVEVSFNDPGTILDGWENIPNDPGPPEVIIVNRGKMVVDFTDFRISHSTRLDGVELMRMNRYDPSHYGGHWEVLYGARYISLMDRFTVVGRNFDPFATPVDPNDPINVPFINPLANSNWSTQVDNNLVGPQIGLRWFRQQGRWVNSAELRFLAAANFQNARLKTSLGSAAGSYNDMFDQVQNVILPREFTGLGIGEKQLNTIFSPVGEWRFNVAWQLSQAVALKVGYTGMIIGGIGRSTNRTRYDGVKLINLIKTGERQTFLANGLNFGVEINR